MNKIKTRYVKAEEESFNFYGAVTHAHDGYTIFINRKLDAVSQAKVYFDLLRKIENNLLS